MPKKQPANRKAGRGPSPTQPAKGSPELELWHRNQEASPLLRLPVEIRLRIFAHILAVGQIHIRYRPWQHKGQIKNGVEGPRPGRFYSCFLSANENPWDPSSTSYTDPSDSITLVSSVCRQLYAETAALPFRLNAWSFENARVMERYVQREKRLTAHQRRAVQTLIVREILPKTMEKRFGGLRVLVRRTGSNKLERQLVEPRPDRSSRNWHAWSDYDFGLHW